MPYDKRSELPKQVKENLPAHAQDIYKESYNNAYERFEDPENIKGNDDQETAAHKVAWAAVKNKYTKEGDKWVEK